MIETKDLMLKQGSLADANDLYRNLWSRDEVFRYMFVQPSPTEEHAMQRTASYVDMQENVETEFFVYDKATEQTIGIAGLEKMTSNVYAVTNIAICPDVWGRGYGKQILNALLSLAFDKLGATVVYYDCLNQNEASKRLAFSCGFTYIPCAPQALLRNKRRVIAHFHKKSK